MYLQQTAALNIKTVLCLSQDHYLKYAQTNGSINTDHHLTFVHLYAVMVPNHTILPPLGVWF